MAKVKNVNPKKVFKDNHWVEFFNDNAIHISNRSCDICQCKNGSSDIFNGKYLVIQNKYKDKLVCFGCWENRRLYRNTNCYFCKTEIPEINVNLTTHDNHSIYACLDCRKAMKEK